MFPVNVPNVLTVLRILLVPVLVVALLDETPNGDLFAAVVFVVASLTDLLDGYLARTRNAVTTFGKLMDPIADKLLIVAALVALVSLHRLAAWVAMVIIARELSVTALRMAATQQGVVISASLFGKAKTCFQIAAVLALIAADAPTPGVGRRARLRDRRRHRRLRRRLLPRRAPPARRARPRRRERVASGPRRGACASSSGATPGASRPRRRAAARAPRPRRSGVRRR